MTDEELDALLANAKPAHNKGLGFAWSNYGQFCMKPYFLPFGLFSKLTGGECFESHYYVFPTEAAAMDALRAAVAVYKETP